MNTATLRNIGIIGGVLVLNLLSTVQNAASAQTQNVQGQKQGQDAPATLGLEQGYIELDTPEFKLRLVKASQTIAALQPKGAKGFDFTPAYRLESRARDGYQHLGDLTLRICTGNFGP